MVPETFEKNIKNLNKVANNNSLNIQNALDNQTAALKSSSKRSDDSNDEIARISEIITHLQSALEKKDEEMERFKKGYDADIYKQFLLRFTKVDRVLKEYIDDGEIDLDGLGDIQEEMEEALLECRVESFSPEVGVDYKAQDNIADNPKKIPTTDKNQHETVAEVIQMGYVRKCEDSSIEVISKAKVKVYDFAESEKNDESNAVNNDESNAVNNSDILSLLEIDPTLSNNEILGQLDKEFSKLNNRLHSLIDGEEKNNANQRIELINQAKKIYESK